MPTSRHSAAAPLRSRPATLSPGRYVLSRSNNISHVEVVCACAVYNARYSCLLLVACVLSQIWDLHYLCWTTTKTPGRTYFVRCSFLPCTYVRTYFSSSEYLNHVIVLPPYCVTAMDVDETATASQGARAGTEIGADSPGLPLLAGYRPIRHPWMIPDKLAAAGVYTVAEVISKTQGRRGFLVSIRSRDFQKIRGKVIIRGKE